MPLMGLKTDKLYLPWTRITEVPAGVGGDPNWANVQGKPTTLAGYGVAAEVDAAAHASAIGSGQTWQDVTAQRAFDTTYTNTTGKPISILVNGLTSGSGGGITVTVGGVGMGYQYATGSGVGCTSNTFVVPNGSTYRVGAAAGVSASNRFWFELRG